MNTCFQFKLMRSQYQGIPSEQMKFRKPDSDSKIELINKNIMESELEKFNRAFKEFITPYTCLSHKQTPTFVCIDSSCRQRGLICSICLTIRGEHKNHDSIEVSAFVDQCLQAFSKEVKKDDVTGLLRKIDEAYEEVLKILTQFHEGVSNLIKSYISRKNQVHTQREAVLFTENSLSSLKACKFKNLEDMNRTLTILMGRMSNKLQIDQKSENVMMEKTQYYLEDLNYEMNIIGRELRVLEMKLKELLKVKESSPLVLHMQPTFNAPKFFENQEVVYLGETKLDRPHGKGICYFKTTQKIIWGEFHNGQLEGTGELYFATGDYYIGDFRNDKKDGRGSYHWTGKEANLYEGEFRAGKRNGRGTFWWADGSYYQGICFFSVGDFKEGVQSGVGTLFREGGVKEYHGFWLNGMFDGVGTQYFDNGERYEGHFKEDKFHGQGVFYKDDSIIYGVWKDNELSVVNMVKSSLSDK